MRSVISALAAGFRMQGDVYNELLGDLKSKWASNNPDSKSKNPNVSTAQKVVFCFPELKSEERYKVMSKIVGRPVTTTYDLKLAEALAIRRVAQANAEDFEQYINDLMEETIEESI